MPLTFSLENHQSRNSALPQFAHRHFSAASEKKEETTNDDEEKEEESLKDTVRRMQQEKGKTADDDGSEQMNDFMRKASSFFSIASEEVSKTWGELLASGERGSINKKIGHPEDTVEGEEEYTGPVEIMVIDESENMTAWERMQKRLTDAPVIQGKEQSWNFLSINNLSTTLVLPGFFFRPFTFPHFALFDFVLDILSRSEQVYEKSGARKAKQKMDHMAEDAREAWETSQNPWVYRASSVYETITAETPESIAVAELRKLDPDFTLDDWREDVVEHNLPKIMEWLLMGKINQLKPWLGEGVFKRIAAEITARKQEGVQIDTTVLGIMNSEILAVEPDEVEKGSPIIVLHFMCQQINCVRKKKDGTIVEGSEDDIKANSYVAAFQREYDAKKGELNWKIVDFRFNGAIAYL